MRERDGVGGSEAGVEEGENKNRQRMDRFREPVTRFGNELGVEALPPRRGVINRLVKVGDSRARKAGIMGLRRQGQCPHLIGQLSSHSTTTFPLNRLQRRQTYDSDGAT